MNQFILVIIIVILSAFIISNYTETSQPITIASNAGINSTGVGEMNRRSWGLTLRSAG